MPEKETVRRARKAKQQGKAPSTQAGEFVREEIHHVRSGKHGARSAKQAIAIGLSKARRSGVKLQPPEEGQASERTRKQASREAAPGRARKKPSRRRARASKKALEREGRGAASPRALSRQAKSQGRRRAGSGTRSRTAAKGSTSRRRATGTRKRSSSSRAGSRRSTQS